MGVLSRRTSVLQRVNAPLDTVQQDVTALKVWVHAPAADKLHLTLGVIILGVAVKEANLLEARAGGVLADGAHIHNAETTRVIGLIRQPVNHVLVVVNGSHR